MRSKTVVLSLPGLRVEDLPQMPRLAGLLESGSQSRIEHSFPAVTWPSQATVLTGKKPSEHGIIANGFYWRDQAEVEMWTAWNEVIQAPQVWDLLKQQDSQIKTAAWFPMLSKGCGADFVCMPAPIHRPDGSEDLWCYTKPQEFYGELLGALEHFPLQHFWGPLANIQSSQWILKSALLAAESWNPDFWYIYLPHLDYAAQKLGPDSPAAQESLAELDQAIGEFAEAYQSQQGTTRWLIVSEYVIHNVDHVTYPNRVLRDFGLLKVQPTDRGEHLDLFDSPAWALVDHQFSHVFVKDRDPSTINQVREIFDDQSGIQMVLTGDHREYLDLNHERSGDVVLVSDPKSWQAYYWWQEDSAAPEFARTVDIHQKPGYDPVELFFDPATKSIPLDATLVKGSHGVPALEQRQQGLIAVSGGHELPDRPIRDTEILEIMMKLVLES